ARAAAGRQPCGGRDRPGPQVCGRAAGRARRAHPAGNLEPANALRLLAADLPNRLVEGPDVAFEVASPVRARAVEVVFRLGQDVRAGCPGALAVGVHVLLEIDVNDGRIGALDSCRALRPVDPLGADHNAALAANAHL